MTSRFYISAERVGSKLIHKFIDEQGQRRIEEVDPKDFLHLYRSTQMAEPGMNIQGQDGALLYRVPFNDFYGMSKYIDENIGLHGMNIYGIRDPEIQFLASEYVGKIPFNMAKINGCVVDIETESGNIVDGKPIPSKFVPPSEATAPVTAVTLYETNRGRYYTFALKQFQGVALGEFSYANASERFKAAIKEEDLTVLEFTSEIELLMELCSFFKSREYDFISGWKSETYDIPYLLHRVEKVLGRSASEMFSPYSAIRKRNYTGSFGKEELSYTVSGLAQLDYYQLVEKHAFVELSDTKLNTAAEHFLGIKKVDYSKHRSLTELYVNDYQNFIEYNIIDVQLITALEKKLKYFSLSFILAYLYRCNPEDTMSTVKPWMAFMYHRCLARSVMPKLQPRKSGGDYGGGYVMDPVPGLRRWALSIDANALYPHMAMQYNMGIETILPNTLAMRVWSKMADELRAIDCRTTVQETLLQRLDNQQSFEDIYFEEPYEFKCLKELKVCVAPNLATFNIRKDSVLRLEYESLYADRSVIKKQMIKVRQEAQTKKYDYILEYERLCDLADYQDNTQHAFKIVANAGYGAIANENFVDHFDLRIAEAITFGGRVGIRYVGKCINDYLSEKYGVVKDWVFYADTDSLYIDAEEIVAQSGLTGTTEIVNMLDQLCSVEIEKVCKMAAESLAAALGCNRNSLFFKREVIAERGWWVTKKRYTLLANDVEGVRYDVPKLKVTGLEAKKSTYPLHCRNAMLRVYEKAMREDQEGVWNEVSKFEEFFNSQPLQDIAKISKVTDIEKYLIDSGGVDDSRTVPYHVRACVYHNQLIDRYGLDGVVPKIQSGDKVLLLPLNSSKASKNNYIAFAGKLPDEFNLDGQIDKRGLFESNFISPIGGYLESGKMSVKRPTTFSLF